VSLMSSPLIVVGLVNSPSSAAALHWAAGEAIRLRAGILAVHAWEVPARSESRLVGDLAEARGQIQERAFAWTVDALARTGLDVTVALEVRDGLAGPTLVAASQDAALLVLGGGGGGAIENRTGDVVGYCRDFAPCRVIVVDDPHTYPPIASTSRPVR